MVQALVLFMHTEVKCYATAAGLKHVLRSVCMAQALVYFMH
jgi:hypothetical protein